MRPVASEIEIFQTRTSSTTIFSSGVGSRLDDAYDALPFFFLRARLGSFAGRLSMAEGMGGLASAGTPVELMEEEGRGGNWGGSGKWSNVGAAARSKYAELGVGTPGGPRNPISGVPPPGHTKQHLVSNFL